MNKWSSVFVSELEHSYKRFKETGSCDTLKKTIRRGLRSTNDFERAFSCALINWLSTRHFDMRNEIPEQVMPLQDPAYPKVFDHPTASKESLVKAIPEFKEYNIYITYFGEKE